MIISALVFQELLLQSDYCIQVVYNFTITKYDVFAF